MIKLTKKQAEKLVGIGAVAELVRFNGQDQRLTANGCKVYCKKQGCIYYFYLDGYAYDGMDIQRDMDLL